MLRLLGRNCRKSKRQRRLTPKPRVARSAPWDCNRLTSKTKPQRGFTLAGSETPLGFGFLLVERSQGALRATLGFGV